MPTTHYPVDYTGLLASNQVQGEQQIITPPGLRRYHFMVPRFAPFYENGLTISLRDINNVIHPLVKGVDFYLTHKFMDASLATMHPIYGSITFLRRDIVGTVILTYQTLGGVWTIDDQAILQILAETSRNPRETTWEQVVERPIDFPVVDHEWNLDDMVGAKEIVQGIAGIEAAILSGLDPGQGGMSWAQHIQNYNNPHQTTAFQTGAYTIAQVNAFLVAKLDANATALNSARLANRDSDQLKAWVLEGTAANALLFNGRTYAQVLSDVQTSVGANAITFGGMDTDAFRDWVLTGKAAEAAMADDAVKLDGKTYQELVDDIAQQVGDLDTLLREINLEFYLPTNFLKSVNLSEIPEGNQTGPVAWTRIGYFTPHVGIENIDVLWMINVTSDDGIYSAMVQYQFDEINEEIIIGRRVMAESGEDIRLGWNKTNDPIFGDIYNLYVETPSTRKNVGIVAYTSGSFLINDNPSDVVFTEPVGIEYTTSNEEYASVGQLQQLNTQLTNAITALSENTNESLTTLQQSVNTLRLDTQNAFDSLATTFNELLTP